MAGVGRHARGSALVELILLSGVVVALLAGVRELASGQEQALAEKADQHQSLWTVATPGAHTQGHRSLWVAEGAVSAAEAESRAMAGLPSSGASWAAIQPLPYALSYTG
ncbi:MAG: hypothetical protein ACPGUF_00960, partial [Litorivicinus sp.]